MANITAAQLYDYIACPHRVALDAFGSAAERDETSPFVRLLWERGSAFELQVAETLPKETEMLSELAGDEKLVRTLKAIEARCPVIHGGRIAAGELLGEPDLLLLRADGYIAADIKSGRGETGGDDGDSGTLKPHYAVQVALYTDIMEKLGHSSGRTAEIWDIRGERVPYDFSETRTKTGTETWWDFYERVRDEVAQILEGEVETRGALASICGLCHWRTKCQDELIGTGDLSLIPALGRALRDTMSDAIGSVQEFAESDPEAFIEGKKTRFARLGADRLRLFQQRAKLLTDPGATAFLRAPIELPVTDAEIFFDIEADPMRDLVYLHGFVERNGRDPATERFTYFYADGVEPEYERAAFAGAIEWIKAHPHATLYYYSKYERTEYRKLQQRYPEVCSADEIEDLFTPPRSIDLYYDVVLKATEWPTHNHSIKTLAKHLGFAWRDTDPSGAASIEWFHRWVESGDPAIKQRIVDYNEDDCRATGVLLDGIRGLA